MARDKCSIENCSTPIVALGFCDKHYRRFKKHGDPAVVIKTKSRKVQRFCSVPNCAEKHSARGYCAAHYRRFRHDPAKMGPLPECSLDDCTSARFARGYCEPHYRRYLKHGDPLAGKSVKRVWNPEAHPGPLDECALPDCNGKRVARGYCNRHYLLHQKYGDPNGGKSVRRSRRAIDHSDGTRTCLDCGETKPLDSFPRDRSATKGRRSNCRPCHTARVKSWYSTNAERQSSRQRARYAQDLEASRQTEKLRYERDREKRIRLATDIGHRRRARLRDAGPSDYGISVRALRPILGDACPRCGLLMLFRVLRKGDYEPRKATIDHIVPISQGGTHTWDNVQLMCWQCNITKGGRSEDDVPSVRL